MPAPPHVLKPKGAVAMLSKAGHGAIWVIPKHGERYSDAVKRVATEHKIKLKP
jgi:hypothetical protein